MQNSAMTEALARLIAVPILMGIIGGIAVISYFIFWLWMLIDCLENEKENKTSWVLMLIFLAPVGAILYHRIAKKKKWLVNTIFISALIIGGIGILTIAYIERYEITTVPVKKKKLSTTYRNKPKSIKTTYNKQQTILNLPYNFTSNKSQRNNRVYIPNLPAATKIYRTQNTSIRDATSKTYIYKWVDEKQQEHFSNMQPPTGTKYTKNLSRY